MNRKMLDVRALYRDLDLIRCRDGITWRAVSRQTGIPASTFSRLADGRRPDVDSLCTLVAWLRVPLDRFTVPYQTDDDGSA